MKSSSLSLSMSPSPLTRYVFRALIANRPYRAPECLLRLRMPSHYGHGRRLIVAAARHERRLFHTSPRQQIMTLDVFNNTLRMSPNAKRTPQNIERALNRLVDVSQARRTQTRPPPSAEVLTALKFLAAVRADDPQHLTSTEIGLIAEGLAYAQEQGLVLSESGHASLERSDLLNIFNALAQSEQGGRLRGDSRTLADRLFQVLCTYDNQVESEAEAGVDNEVNGDKEVSNGTGNRNAVRDDVLVPYITLLARTGSLDDALKLLRSMKSERGQELDQELDEELDEDLDQEQRQKPLVSAWLAVLKNEPRPAAFQKLLGEFQERMGPLSPLAHEELVRFAASQGRLGLCKELLDYKFQSREPLTTAALAYILKLCIQKGQRNLASHCAEQLLKRQDINDAASGVLLLWYASESPTARLLKQKMIELQEHGRPEALSAETFNMLLDFAYRNNDPKQAQKFIDLANFFGVVLNSASHALKLQYELSQEKVDIDAVMVTFFAMVNGDVPSDRSDTVAMNKLLQKLTSAPEPRYDLIMRVVDRVIDTGADLDAASVTGLCSVFLQRNDSENLAELVRFRVDAFSLAERARIISVFKEYILDTKRTSDQQAWDTYDLVRNAFPEMSAEDQMQVMNNFFEREKPDFATLVFTHMHQRPEPQLRPDAEAYAQCLFGVARCRDVDGVQQIYNMLKLDQTVEPTTKVRNALMAAYTACRMPYTSIIDHWWKILDSRDGPSFSSFLLALRACETWIPFGSLEARRIIALAQSWDLLDHSNPTRSRELYEAYLGAIAGQSEFENAVELIEYMQEDLGQAPDARTIGIFYNAIPWQYRKDEVERWARRAFPELWAELESWGDVIDEDWHIRYFNVDRTVDVDDDLLFPRHDSADYHTQHQLADRSGLPPPLEEEVKKDTVSDSTSSN